MIRIARPATAPAALNTSPIQTYLAAYTAYKADDSLPEPKLSASYRSADLFEAFDTYFHAKCYLTEQKFASSWEMDVDHFEPVNQAPLREYDWTNLFPAAHKANMMRPRRLPAGGLLNPCVDDVETELIYTLVDFGQEPGFQARDPGNQAAVNTAHLLNELHNGKANNADSRSNTRELRQLIKRQYDKVLLAWDHYRNAVEDDDAQEIAQAGAELRNLLSRRASFTMLIRSLPFVRKRIPSHLLD